MPDPVPLRPGQTRSTERVKIDVEFQHHLDELAVEAQAAQPPGVERRDAEQVAQAGAMQAGDSSATTTGPPGLVTRRISRRAARGR